MNIEGKILIIDDEVDICDQLSGLLNDRGFNTKYCISSEEGIKEFRKNSYSLVILDIWLNDSKFDGFQTLEQIKELNETVPIIMISGHGNIETAVNSIKKGAYDFIEKPLDGELLIFKVTKALENYDLKNKINNLYVSKNDNYIANSEASKKVLHSLNKISKTDSSILLSGLNGSGREFLARKIHLESNRNNKRLKVIDFSDFNKVETEEKLFGSEEKGIIKSLGILEEVNGGSLFIKNIDKMNSKVQGKFLRVLEEKKYYRVGGLSSNKIDLRIISSSKMLLNELRKCNTFRSDLLNKINFFEIMVPSIKQRIEDINGLVTEFLNSSLDFHKMNIENVSNDAILFFSELVCFNSIAQLKKFIEWSVFMLSEDKNEKITKEKIINLLTGFLNEKEKVENNHNIDYLDSDIKQARESFEKNYLSYNLRKYNNNISQVSQKIGMERTALYRKLKSLKINSGS
ncbi:MAG: hypothetical protein CMP38_04630 [Rickettsiales bacterium]|nr:hypothetical protein [Rickettsiales bacterium]